MKSLKQTAQDYIRMRRLLGFKMRHEERRLRRFVSFMELQKATYITTKLALTWATEPADAQPATWAERLMCVRVFARYCSGADPRTEVPPLGILEEAMHRIFPAPIPEVRQARKSDIQSHGLGRSTDRQRTSTKAEVMLRSIKQLYGEKLRASDGEIGHVKDFSFDDQKWVVRYAVIDTGSWLLGRLVLIAPHAFGNVDQNRSLLLVNLTRQQIENSPPIESHKPVSRQYEEEYHRYYGWPSYWVGEGISGPNALPIAQPPLSTLPIVSPPPPPLPS